MNDIIQAMETRRSIRQFKPDMPRKEELQQIIEAGLYAANGRGRQGAIILAVTNRELRDRLSALNREIGGFPEGKDPFYGAPAVLIVLVTGIVFGLVQGFLVAYMDIQPFIVTLAGMFFARGMTAIISKDMISITNETFMAWAKMKLYIPFGGYLNKKGVMIYPYIYPTVVIALVLLVLAFIMLKYTKFGRSIYAIGGNEQSALMMGLNVRRVKLKAYILDGFLCGVGSILFCLNTLGGFVEQAKGFEMDAIASSVIGGTLLTGGVGNVFGTLFGVLIKATIEAFITFQGTLSSWWTRITIAALLCFFIVLQSILAMVKKKK